MHKSAAVQLLKTFSSKEIKDFDKFIKSPFFNNQKTLIKLYNNIKKFGPDYTDIKLSKENLYGKLYSDKKYNDENMRRLVSDLKKLIDEFLSHTQFRNDSNRFEIMLLNQYTGRHQEKLFEQRIERFAEKINDTENYDGAYFEAKKEIHSLMLGYIFHLNKINYRNYDFSKRSEYIIYSFLNDILNLKFDTLYVTREMSRNNSTTLLDEFFKNFDVGAVIDYLKKENSPYYKTFGLIYAGLQAFINNDDDRYYHEYKALVDKYFSTFSKGYKYVLYINLSTFCAFKIERGKILFRNELFALYDKMLNEGFYIFSENGYFDINLWRQILLTSVILKKYDWARDFIKNYKHTLSPETKNDMVNLSYSRICFAKGMYEIALEYISDINSDYSIFKTDIRNLMLQIYYEMGYTEQLLSLLDSYKHFLSNNQQISTFKREKYSGFIKNINTLLRLKRNTDKDKIKLFIDDVLNSQASFGDWIISKAHEIKTA